MYAVIVSYHAFPEWNVLITHCLVYQVAKYLPILRALFQPFSTSAKIWMGKFQGKCIYLVYPLVLYMMNGILDLPLIGRIFGWHVQWSRINLIPRAFKPRIMNSPIYMWGVGFKKRGVSLETLIHSNLQLPHSIYTYIRLYIDIFIMNIYVDKYIDTFLQIT